MRIRFQSRDLAALSPADQEEARRAVRTINKDPCADLTQPYCPEDPAYRDAWETLLRLAPDAALPHFFEEMRYFSGRARELVLVNLLSGFEAEAFLYASSPKKGAKPYEVPVDTIVLALLEYQRYRPEADVKGVFKGLAGPFVGARLCFSSARFPFPHLQSPRNPNAGWEYLPLIDAELDRAERNCKESEVVELLRDLRYLRGGEMAERIEKIVAKYWSDRPEFARPFLRLVLALPYEPKLERPVRRAVVNVIPLSGTALSIRDDDAYIGSTLNWVFVADREAGFRFREALAEARPQYRAKLEEMTRLWGP